MVTVSHIVRKIIQSKPYIEEAMRRDLISYGSLAEQVIEEVEKELSKKVKHSAIVMALRRYSDELIESSDDIKQFDYSSDIVIKTNLADIGVIKSNSLMADLKNLYSMVDIEKGDTLNIIAGNYEVSIIISEKYLDKLLIFLKGEKIINKEINLVALSISFKGDFFYTPGVIFNVVRRLAWEKINIYEIVSTMTELTIILNKKDSMKAYNALQDLCGVNKKGK